MKFINRTEEIKYLHDYFGSESNAMLFLYGPKSCGKSTLVKKVIQELDPKVYAVNYLSLRNVSISTYQNFMEKFFPRSKSKTIADMLAGVSMDVGLFKVGIEDEAFLAYDPFAYITKKIKKANSKGIKPVLVIDEIQLLKDIYTDKQVYLIDKLFNLFVALTKQDHLAHVVLATSDSFFMQEIVDNAKLSMTATFFHLKHLTKGNIEKWLIEDVGFLDDNFKTVWQLLGGNAWEITEVVNRSKNGEAIVNICQELIGNSIAKFNIFLNFEDDDEKRQLFIKITKELSEKKQATVSEFVHPKLKSLLIDMIEKDLWFYDPFKGTISPNSTSVWQAMKKISE